jgi:hypothetical protein
MKPLNWEQAERARQREARRTAAELRRLRRENVVSVPRRDLASPDDDDMPAD